MWITTDVELPMELVEAHSSGKLVLFVGAGASRNPPSSLPLFDELAEQIGAMAHRAYPGNGFPIDQFLGELLEDFDVHKHVRRLIDRPGSEPNDNHKAAVRLAASGAAARIITTNFDEHLRTAAIDAGLDFVDTYYAPALPVGRDFEGLAYLHGSINRPAQELVLTDHDFGRAYLTDAWATRFLREVFDHFVVLFVGFSHNDPIINYLGMGLPSSTRRYILTDLADDQRWKRLRITPVAYPPDNNHAAATRAMQEWGRRASMGRLEHSARIRDIVQGGPPKSPVEIDYLAQMLEDPQGAREFADIASGVEWLNWLEQFEIFSSHFKSQPTTATNASFSEASAVLAHWFCETYIANRSYQGAALDLIQRTGQQVSRQLAAAAPWAVRRLAEKDAIAAHRWTVLLTTSISGNARQSFDPRVLDAATGINYPALREGLRPYLKLRRDYWNDLVEDASGENALPAAELAWTFEKYAAEKCWKDLKQSGRPFGHQLCTLFENALLAGHELLEAWAGAGTGTGGLSVHRSAIEPHAQDRFREVLDVLIDGLRDTGEQLIATAPELVDRWWSFEYPLFRRLALHLLGLSPVWDPSAKIRWLLDHDLIFDYHTKHETYAVLRNHLQDASPELKDALLKRIAQGPTCDHEVETRHVDYMKYNVLVWITAADPAWVEARSAMERLQTAGNFLPREHPDFDHWFESGVWGGSPPASREEYIERIQRDGADAALKWLLAKDYSERTFEGYTWDDALELLTGVAESDPPTAMKLWTAATLNQDERGPTIRKTLAYGWARADLGNLGPTIVENVAALLEDPEAADAVSVFLLEQVDKQSESSSADPITRLRELARSLWENHSGSFTAVGEIDPTMLGLNSWPGRVARYWVKEISRRWKSDPDNWHGLNTYERGALLQLLYGSGPALDATRPSLTGEVYFMFSADSGFTAEHLFPLFATPGLERQSWEPYLYHPRWNNRFLEQGFVDLVVNAYPRLEGLSNPSLEGQYWRLLVSIVSFSDIEADKRATILDHLVLEQDGHYFVRFLDCLAMQLSGEQPDKASQLWDEWIGVYMQRRFDGQPRRPAQEELEAWADLVPFFASRIPSAAGIVSEQPIALRSTIYWEPLPDSTINSQAQALSTYLIHRLQSSARLDDLVSYSVAEFGKALLPNLDPVARQALVAAAAEHAIKLMA